MTTTLIPVSAAFDLVGPWLVARAACPACQHVNVLAHIETYGSPVKVIDVCEHVRALDRDDDGERFIEFEH
jgi:hypothetical protein